MKEFYVFRHGETEMNRLRKWQGRGIDLPLNENGRKQASDLAERLKELGLEAVFSSPLKRALETARITAGVLNIPVFVKEDLTEGSFGVAEGKTREEIAAMYPDVSDAWHNLDADYMDACFLGGESKRQIQSRVLRALDEIAAEPYRKVGISVHSAVIRYLLLYFGVKQQQIPHGEPFRFCRGDDGAFFYQKKAPENGSFCR